MVVVREGSTAEDVSAAIQDEMEARGVDVLVLGCHGIAGPRVGTLVGWTIRHLHDQTALAHHHHVALTRGRSQRTR